MPVALSIQDLAAAEAPAEDLIEDAEALVAAALPDEPDAELSLLLGSDIVVRTLNAKWRGIDRSTDVLSFPQDDPIILGDLVLSLPTAIRQARERGWSLRTELRVLLVHGFLHLLGYDHETGATDFAEMAAAERKLLDRLAWDGSGLVEQADEGADTAPPLEDHHESR
jgi:probable rRNA maturation factor